MGRAGADVDAPVAGLKGRGAMVMTHPASGRRAGQKTAPEPGFDQSARISGANTTDSPARGVPHKARRLQENRPLAIFSYGPIPPGGSGDCGSERTEAAHRKRDEAGQLAGAVIATTRSRASPAGPQQRSRGSETSPSRDGGSCPS